MLRDRQLPHLLLPIAALALACGTSTGIVGNDGGPQMQTGPADAGVDAGPDAGASSGHDAGSQDAGPRVDSGVEDAGTLPTPDAGADAGPDAGLDAGYNGTAIQIPGQAPYDTWTWLDVPNTICGNGSATGLGINPHQGATKLLIFLAGGGMCFDYETCFLKPTATNLTGFGASDLTADIGELTNEPGGLNRTDADNIFQDYNYVLLPYCTGDIFAGTQAKTYDDPLGGQHVMNHVGHLNIEAYMQVLVPTFGASASQVVFSGSSAGGFGALINYDVAAQAFSPTPVLLIDDSGPPMRNPYLATSLLTTIWNAWGMAGAMPPGCTNCTIAGGMSNLVPYLTSNPSFRGALISSEQDDVIKEFLTIGNPLMQLGTYYQTGLNDLYQNVILPSGPGELRAYFIQSTQHVWFVFNDPGVVTTGGVTLQQFLTNEVTPDAGFNSALP